MVDQAPKPPGYPYYSLDRAIAAAEAVRDSGGANQDVLKSTVAAKLQLTEDSPTLLGVLGAARLFGLITGRGSYRLTDLAKCYFYPTVDADPATARVLMAKEPPLFSALIDRFDGSRLPNAEFLANLFAKEYTGISESWRPRVASLFLSTVRDARIVDAAGVLRFKASLNGSSAVRPVPPPPAANESPLAQPQVDVPSGTSKNPPPPRDDIDVWTFSIGSDSVRVETSSELSMAAWTKLEKYVKILRPDGDGDNSSPKGSEA
jgi:hypothetical protein